MSNQWIKWAMEIQALAQNGLTFTQCQFDEERYTRLMEIAAEMMAESSTQSVESILGLFNQEKGYATPKIDVRGAIFHDHQVLLVQERSDKKWTLPGGWADVNISPALNIQKEIREESGLEVKVKKLIAVYDKFKHDHPLQWPHTYKCFFLCEWISGEPTPSIETEDVAFFKLNELPALSMARVTPKQIARCYDHYIHFDLPTDFD